MGDSCARVSGTRRNARLLEPQLLLFCYGFARTQTVAWRPRVSCAYVAGAVASRAPLNIESSDMNATCMIECGPARSSALGGWAAAETDRFTKPQ